MSRRWWRRWLPTVLGAVGILLFVLAMVFFAWRDSRAVDRCEAIGGQTWDSGTHCVIGGRVVSTR